VLHRDDPLSSRTGWLKPFLFYLAITLRLLFFHIPIAIVMKPMRVIWNHTGVKAANLIPERLRIPLGALFVLGVMMIGAFASPESQDNTRANRAVSLFGLLVIIFALWATSKHRSMVKWHTVIVGMLVQFIVALFVLRSRAGCWWCPSNICSRG
jgi:CNT family concentrative nucleoside transporter